MRTDVLPLCDEHFRTMEHCLAPFSTDYSIEFFRCTAQFCHRCFSERLGYVTPKRGSRRSFVPISHTAMLITDRCLFPVSTDNAIWSGSPVLSRIARKRGAKMWKETARHWVSQRWRNKLFQTLRLSRQPRRLATALLTNAALKYA